MTIPSAAGSDYAGDRGEADPDLRALLAVSGQSQEHYLAAIAALCSARLLLPVVTVAAGAADLAGVDRIEPEHPERDEPEQVTHEVVAVTLAGPDGSKALPAFTGLDAITSWHPGARPVPCRLDEVAGSAVEQGAGSIVIDLVGPHPLVIETELLTQFAQGRRLVRLDDGGWGWLYAADSPSGGPVG